MQSRATALLWDTREAVAYVVGDLSKPSTTSYKELWRRDRAVPYMRPPSSLQLIGTCNGLLCLCDNKTAPGGAVTLVNPATDEVLPVPPLPCALSYFPPAGRYASWENWHEAYSFGYHPTSSWVVSFDLESEEVTRVKGLPAQPGRPDHYHLTEVNGRLGIVVRSLSGTIKVWVMDKGRRKWSYRYNLTRYRVPRPHFVYGECILTLQECSICGHYRQKGMWSSSNNTVTVRVRHQAHGTLMAAIIAGWCRTFSYVKTMEPLSVYKLPIVNA